MKKPRYTEQQIAEALRQVEQGTAATVVCRKLGVSETTFYHRARPLYRIWEKIPTMASRNGSYRRSTAFRRRRVRRPETFPVCRSRPP